MISTTRVPGIIRRRADVVDPQFLPPNSETCDRRTLAIDQQLTRAITVTPPRHKELGSSQGRVVEISEIICVDP